MNRRRPETSPADFEPKPAAARAGSGLDRPPPDGRSDEAWQPTAADPLAAPPSPAPVTPASPRPADRRPGPPPPDPTAEQMQRHLRAANAIARQALEGGHHPFGALLVGPDHETVLMAQGNIDTVNHAEAVLIRMASRAWSADELWGCTLYSTVEPCCMCSGTQYWANVGRLVYGMAERRLAECTGAHPANPTFDLPSRRVFASGQKGIRVWGPIPELEDEIAALHADFWKRDGR